MPLIDLRAYREHEQGAIHGLNRRRIFPSKAQDRHPASVSVITVIGALRYSSSAAVDDEIRAIDE